MIPSGTRGFQSPRLQPTVFDPDLQTRLQSGWNAHRTPITVNQEDSLLDTENATEVDDSQTDPFPPSSDQWGPEEWEHYFNSFAGNATTSQTPQSPAWAPSLPQTVQSQESCREVGTDHTPDLPELTPSSSYLQDRTENMSYGKETANHSQKHRHSQTETYLRQMIMCASLGITSEPELPKRLKKIVDIVGPDFRASRSGIPQSRKEYRDALDQEFEIFCGTKVEEYMRRKREISSS